MKLSNVNNFKSLLPWLSNELNWNIGIDDFEDINDITYNFTANDIHLKPEEFAKITFLKQLRPLIEKQPWGIFAVEFEGKRFEISSLRKILAGLVPKRRNQDHAVWDKENLLFFCFWGEKSKRCFGAFHFEDKENALPSLKAFHIEPKNEDPFVLQNFEERLKKLAWPVFPQKLKADDFKNWHKQWTGAFTQVYRQAIYNSNQLTENLAGIALEIRRKILAIFEVETNDGAIHGLYEKFRKALIHDMTKEQFADMYAQTMVYGLFSARLLSGRLLSGRLLSGRFNSADESEYDTKKFDPRAAIDNIPSTNPFLQNLLKESFSRKNKLSFDELDLSDITLLLENTNTELIIEDFNRQTGGGREDPVIYFYEGFLNSYEKEQKKRRGVYYTPQPVVEFMVQAVDDILKTEFGIKDGLASTETKTINIPKKKDGKVVATEVKTVPAIQILDPSVGTGTFLRQIVLQIWDNFKKANAGQTKNSIKRMWNVYVKDHLLPRLNGFELMMAPYAVAHMKLALVLWDTEYAYDEDEADPHRVNIFLTNSLEEADREGNQVMMFEHDALAAESEAAKATKKNRGINVVIGNPPYSGESANKGSWILSLLDDYKKEPGGIERLQERNPKWINDDYVKFIRYAQAFVERSGSGIVAYINNHSFLDNPTFRGMRWNLLKSFDKFYIIDLHGNAKKKETAPDGGKDENVFDIQQGVSINIFVKTGTRDRGSGIRDCCTKNKIASEIYPGNPNTNFNSQPPAPSPQSLAKVFHCDLWGLREDKYIFLRDQKIGSVKWKELELAAPQYFFVQKDFGNKEKYDEGFQVQDLFQINSVGIVTANDKLFINRNKKLLKENINNHFNNIKDDDFKKYIKEISYRPFDTQYIFYDPEKIERPREKVMRHFVGKKNIALVHERIVSNKNIVYRDVYITNTITDAHNIGSAAYIFPLYLYEGKKRSPNLNPSILAEIELKLNMKFFQGSGIREQGTGIRERGLSELSSNFDNNHSYDRNTHSFHIKTPIPDPRSPIPTQFTPINLFDYIYAVLHSPAYRETFREFLKIDFPRIPYPTEKEVFWKLAALGGELRQLHLLEGPIFEENNHGGHGVISTENTEYRENSVNNHKKSPCNSVPSVVKSSKVPSEKVLVEKVKYANDKVFVNGDFYFDGVSETAWEFYIGGYMPAQKWLKDRKGTVLKAEDIRHYRKIVFALTETARVMEEIDQVGVV